MKAHKLAEELLKCDNVEITASIDISTGDNDSGRRIFTDDCMGINSYSDEGGFVTILFSAEAKDNFNKKI